jgi:hypothetical protein
MQKYYLTVAERCFVKEQANNEFLKPYKNFISFGILTLTAAALLISFELI